MVHTCLGLGHRIVAVEAHLVVEQKGQAGGCLEGRFEVEAYKARSLQAVGAREAGVGMKG